MNNFVIQTLAIRFYLIVKIIKNIFFSYFNFLINQKQEKKGGGKKAGKRELGCGLPISFRTSILIFPYHESLPVPRDMLPLSLG